MGMKIPKSDLKLEQDPFLLLGFGMNAYFDLIKYMFYIFAIMTLFSLPAMFFYS